MRSQVLPKWMFDIYRVNQKLIISYSDLLTETTAVAFELFPEFTTATPTMPAGTLVTACYLRANTLFVAPSMTDLVVIIGDGGDTARLLASSEVGGTGTPITAGLWYMYPVAKVPYIYTVADTIDITFTATGAALSALTAGELEIYLGILDLKDLPLIV